MLYGWMKSLIIYLIFAGAVINLSPSGSYKKYIKFFTGMVAIIILMKPISYIFSFDVGKLQNIWGDIDGFSEYAADNLEAEDVIDYYELSLSEGIKLELVERGFKVEEVSVITDKESNPLSCIIYVNKESDLDYEFVEGNIKKYLFQVYNLDYHNINVVRR